MPEFLVNFHLFLSEISAQVHALKAGVSADVEETVDGGLYVYCRKRWLCDESRAVF
jgi:hypothetical protein